MIKNEQKEHNPADVQRLKSEVEELKVEVDDLKDNTKELEKTISYNRVAIEKYKELSSLGAKFKKLKKENEKMMKRNENQKHEDIESLKKEHAETHYKWNKLKKFCKEIIQLLSEMNEVSQEDFMENLGLEMDENFIEEELYYPKEVE
ncbi:hypothetical protein TpMuguga_01g02870 [Theileria parva strain Muguga]|uniref:uncharacterized protein n=1 Tax=Theileria parva strain Muguga TaxID=333668 RepID=UPI001C621324|nr:uncharacterized protein TpMuguga_01g02870 [Theileria parva strain Muguga]KAF5153504.1 hypothetical protein TpMuguga_01g02870 [Theileria parva strain Muguga]